MHIVTTQQNKLSNINLVYDQQGVVQLPQLITQQLFLDIRSAVSKKLAALPELHQCSMSNYFAAVNRWPAKCLVGEECLSESITIKELK